MEATRKQIEVTKEVRAEIKKAFKCSDMTLWRALNFSNDTPTSLRIRKFAKQKGGVLLLLTPATETIHDADGNVRREVKHCTIEQLYVEQTFAGGL